MMKISTKTCFLLLVLSGMACQNKNQVKEVPVNRVLHTEVDRRNSVKTAATFSNSGTSHSSPDISGYYKAVDAGHPESTDEGCAIEVNILKKNTGAFTYNLIAGDTKHTGEVTLTKNNDKSMGIVFEGIPYAEFEGDISDGDDDKERPQLKLPVGIGGILQGDTITIQNYGNSMNYYVVFEGCGAKYLQLVKKH